MREPSSKRVLVILSSVKWGATWQRHHSLARVAAEDGFDVLYIEPHPRSAGQLLRAAARRVLRKAPLIEHPVPEGVMVLPWSGAWSPGIQYRRIRDYLSGSEVWILLYLPSQYNLALVELLSPRRVIYDKVLDWASVPPEWYPPREWKATEAVIEAWAKAGRAAMMTDSGSLKDRWDNEGIDSIVVSPAVDEAFLEFDWSAPRPLGDGAVGYFGSVRAGVVDIDMLLTLAKTYPVEIVGDVPEEYSGRLAEAGVSLRPLMVVTDLVAIIDGWSAIILPYKQGPRSETLVPAKLWNSIATQRPVYYSGFDPPADVRDRIRSLSALAENRPPATLATKTGVRSVLPTWAIRWIEIKHHVERFVWQINE